MYVLINAAVRGEVSFCLLTDQGTLHQQETYPGQNKDVITLLASFLSSQSLAPDAVSGIGVVEGIGGFTSTRIATLVANTFGYVHDLAVIGISEAVFADPSPDIVSAFAAATPGIPLHPAYSGEPNIRIKGQSSKEQ